MSENIPCENLYAAPHRLFETDSGITVARCKIHGNKQKCIHKDQWEACAVTCVRKAYRGKYRIKSRGLFRARLPVFVIDTTPDIQEIDPEDLMDYLQNCEGITRLSLSVDDLEGLYEKGKSSRKHIGDYYL